MSIFNPKKLDKACIINDLSKKVNMVDNVYYVQKWYRIDSIRELANELLHEWMNKRNDLDSNWFDSEYEELFYMQEAYKAGLSEEETEVLFSFLGV
jgi:hypothetical protein